MYFVNELREHDLALAVMDGPAVIIPVFPIDVPVIKS